MSTPTAMMQRGGRSVLAVGAAIAAVVVAGGVIRPARPTGGATDPRRAPVPVVHARTVTLTRGSLAAMRREPGRERVLTVDRIGGMAELYRDHDRERDSAANRDARLGGMAELYHDQAVAR